MLEGPLLRFGAACTVRSRFPTLLANFTMAPAGHIKETPILLNSICAHLYFTASLIGAGVCDDETETEIGSVCAFSEPVVRLASGQHPSAHLAPKMMEACWRVLLLPPPHSASCLWRHLPLVPVALEVSRVS